MILRKTFILITLSAAFFFTLPAGVCSGSTATSKLRGVELRHIDPYYENYRENYDPHRPDEPAPMDERYIEVFGEMLEHGTDREAERIAWVLGDWAGEPTVDMLLECLRYPRTGVKARAALSAAHYAPYIDGEKEQEVVELLVELARDGAPLTQAAALEALGALDAYGEVELFIKKTASETSEIALAALKALRLAGNNRADAALADALTHEETKVAKAAALAAPAAGAEKTAESLVQLMNNGSPALRTLAAQALGKMEVDGKTDDIKAAYDDDKFGPIRRRALETLERLGYIRDNPRVLETAFLDPDYSVRKTGARFAGDYRMGQYIGSLLELLGDPHLDVRDQAAISLTAMEEREEVIEKVADGLESDAGKVRAASSQVLGRLASDRNLESHIELLDDDYMPARRWAAWALGEIRRKEAGPGLLRTAFRDGDSDRALKITSMLALGKIGYEDAIGDLNDIIPDKPEGMYEGTHEELRRGAIKALRIMEAEQEVDILTRRLDDVGPDVEYNEVDGVRYESALALAALGGEDEVEVLDKHMRNERNALKIRHACRWAIYRIKGQWPDESVPDYPHPSPNYFVSTGTDETKIESVFPLGRAQFERRWNMSITDVSNGRPEGKEMEIVLSQRRDMQNVHYRHRFYLPAETRRRVWFPIPFTDSQTYNVRLLDGEGSRLDDAEALNPVYGLDRQVVMGPDTADIIPDFSLGRGDEENGYTRPPGVQRPMRLLTSVQDLPDHPAGYGTADIVVIGEADHRRWRPAQTRALENFVKTGGVLFMHITPNAHNNGLGMLDRLSPVLSHGFRREREFELKGPAGNYSAVFDDYADIAEAEPVRDAQVLLRMGDMPLLVREQRGRGAVYASTAPGKVLDGLRGREHLIADILGDSSVFRALSESRFHREGPSHMDQVAGIEVPSRRFVFGMSVGFVLFATLILSALYLCGRSEWAWAAIIPAAFAATVIVFNIGAAYRRQMGYSFSEFAVLYGPAGETELQRDALLGFFSPESLMVDLVSADTEGATITADFTEEEEGRLMHRHIEVGERYALRGLEMRDGDFPRFSARTRHELEEPVEVEVEINENGGYARVKNHTDFDLDGAMFVANGYPFTIGSINAGAEVEVPLNDRSVGTKWSLTTRTVMGPQALARMNALVDMFRGEALRLASVPWLGDLFFVAWMPEDKDLITERVESDAAHEPEKRSRAALFLSPNITWPGQPGDPVTIPGAFSTTAFRLEDSTAAYHIDTMDERIIVSRLDLLFYLPWEVRRMQPETAELVLDVNTGGQRFKLKGRGHDDEVITLANNITTGRHVLNIPDANRFYDPAHNKLTLNLYVENDDAPTDRYADSRWRVRDAYLTVRGQIKDD